MSTITGRGQRDWGGVKSPTYRLNELEKRIENLVQYGKVEQVDHAKKRARVRIGKKLSNWIPWTQGHADTGSINWHPLQTGAQVAVLAPSGNPSQGYIQPGLYWDTHPPFSTDQHLYGTKWADGTEDTHNKSTKARRITVPAGGSIKLTCGASSIFLDNGKIELEIGGSKLTLTSGDIKAKSDLIETDGPTSLDKGARKVHYVGGVDDDGDHAVDGADRVFV